MLKRLPIDENQMTHMPFLTRGRDGRKVLFYCVAPKPEPGTTVAPVWKVHFLVEGRVPQRLHTRLPDEVCECSPTAWEDAAGWHVSFTAGGSAKSPTFRLCRMDAATLEQVGADTAPMALEITRTGFVYRDRVVWGETENVIHVEEGGRDWRLELPGAFIYRVAYRADAPDKLLITGHWQMESPATDDGAGLFTVEYDLTTGDQQFLESDGKAAYKPTILDGEMLYAERTGDHFEHRRLRTNAQYHRKPAQIVVERPPEIVTGEPQPTVISTVPKRSCSCGTARTVHVKGTARPSCIDCCEKHLGAAYVLIAETLSGYAHRLRAVGHLHEAEDESQAWPPLHTAIRTARKAYQTEAAAPDWQVLEDLVSEARAVAQ